MVGVKYTNEINEQSANLDEAFCVSRWANPFGKGVNPS